VNKPKEPKEEKKNKNTLTYQAGEATHNQNDELIYSKDTIEPFTGSSVDTVSHEGVVGRDWDVDSKDVNE